MDANADSTVDSLLSLLHQSARSGDSNTIATCLQLLVPRYGWEVCAHHDPASGWTPIHSACYSGNLLSLQYLIPSSVESEVAERLVNTTTSHDRLSAAHLAAAAGQFTCLKWLLQWSCDLTVKDVRGESALDKAMSANQTECCQLLVTAGACGRIRDRKSFFPPVPVRPAKRRRSMEDDFERVEKRTRILTLKKPRSGIYDSDSSSNEEVPLFDFNCASTADCTSGSGDIPSVAMQLDDGNLTNDFGQSDCMDVPKSPNKEGEEDMGYECHGLGYPWESG